MNISKYAAALEDKLVDLRQRCDLAEAKVRDAHRLADEALAMPSWDQDELISAITMIARTLAETHYAERCVLKTAHKGAHMFVATVKTTPILGECGASHFTRIQPKTCPRCGSRELATYGPGCLAPGDPHSWHNQQDGQSI